MARPKHYLNFISDLSANDPLLYKGTSNLKVYNFNFRTLCQRTITEIASFCKHLHSDFFSRYLPVLDLSVFVFDIRALNTYPHVDTKKRKTQL